MRNLRNLVLLFAGLIAATALSSPTASAQTVELEREQGGHCPTVVTVISHLPSDTSCSIHFITEPGTTMDLFLHNGVNEIPFSQCQGEFEAAFNENGHGYIYNQVLTPEGGACGREVCDEAEPSPNAHRRIPWEAQLNEPGPTDAGEETLTTTLCLYAHNPTATSEGTPGTTCLINLEAVTVGHQYELHTPPHTPDGHGGAPCINLGGAVEWEAHWISTPSTPRHRGFELHHLNDDPA